MLKKILRAVFTDENLLACLLALVLIALVILSANATSTWIYQGF
jgi:hypothetical protein